MDTFLKRWLTHVLPTGFVRVRHHGWLSGAARKSRLLVSALVCGEFDEPKCTTEVIAGSRRLCAGLQEVIAPMLELGLSAQRIYQDLVTGHGFSGSYPSVWRYVSRLWPVKRRAMP